MISRIQRATVNAWSQPLLKRWVHTQKNTATTTTTTSHTPPSPNPTAATGTATAKPASEKISNVIFINEGKFLKKDEMFVVYQSKEGGFFRVFSVLLGAFTTYNVAQFFLQDDEDEKHSSALLGLLFGGTLLAMQWKINKTLKNVYLDQNGRTVLLDFFKHAGFGNEVIQSETLYMGGYNYFLHKVTKVPIFKYRHAGKKRFGFLKWSQAVDPAIMQGILQKKTFLIGQNETATKVSNTYKRKHML